MLQNGELDDSDFARSDEESEFLTIGMLAYWNEGTDVGPLTWEEILLLRKEANLVDEVSAKLEGDPGASPKGFGQVTRNETSR